MDAYRKKGLLQILVVCIFYSKTSHTVDVCSQSFPGGAICECTTTSSSLSYDCRARNIAYLPRGFQSSATTLNLSNNRIYSVYIGPLNDLRRLTDLYLQANLIHTIEPGSFDGLMSLRQLILASNQLTAIERGVFRHLPSLEELDLSNNKITTINRYAFFTLPSANLINLDNNPVQCGCEEFLLHEFFEIRKSSLMVKNDPCGSNQGINECTAGETLFTPSTSCYQCSGVSSFPDCGKADVRYCTGTNHCDNNTLPGENIGSCLNNADT